MRWVFPVLTAILLAGCLESAKPAEIQVPPSTLTASKPTMVRILLRADANGSQNLIGKLLMGPLTVRSPFMVPNGTGKMQLAVDVRPHGAPPKDKETATVKLMKGKTVVRTVPATAVAQKTIAWINAPAEGAYEVNVSYRGDWDVGVVLTFFPKDYTPGITVTVATPQETQINHTFAPRLIQVPPGNHSRVTLFDYDPHAGIENRQHNWNLSAVNANTDGWTTWGEVHTVDFDAPLAPGDYEFHCDQHASLNGTLRVVAPQA